MPPKRHHPIGAKRMTVSQRLRLIEQALTALEQQQHALANIVTDLQGRFDLRDLEEASRKGIS